MANSLPFLAVFISLPTVTHFPTFSFVPINDPSALLCPVSHRSMPHDATLAKFNIAYVLCRFTIAVPFVCDLIT